MREPATGWEVSGMRVWQEQMAALLTDAALARHRERAGWTPLLNGYEYRVNGRYVASVVLEFFPKTENKDRHVLATLSNMGWDRFTTIREAQEWVEAKVIENKLLKGASW